MIALLSLPKTDYWKETTVTVQDYALGGFCRSLSSPTMQHKKGKTTVAWFKANTFDNQGGFLVQNGNTAYGFTIDNGTDPGNEPYNHPFPIGPIYSTAGYKYYIKNEYHVDRFLVYRSTVPYGDEFELVGYIGTNESYLGLVYQDDTYCIFQTRSGNASGGYDQSIIEVDLDNPSGYTETILTDAEYSTTNVRHYPNCGWHYNHNQSDYVVVVINKRIDGTIKFYCTQILVALKTNLDIWYNITLDHSQEISHYGAISSSDLDTYYNVLGNPADSTKTITEARSIKIGNDIYFIYMPTEPVSGNPIYEVKKFTIGVGLVATYELPVTDIYDDTVWLDNMSFMVFNKQSILVRIKRESDVTSLYKLSTDLSSFTHLQDISTPDGMYLGLPQNLDEIPRNERYMIAGRSTPSTGGEVPVIITNRKWL